MKRVIELTRKVEALTIKAANASFINKASINDELAVTRKELENAIRRTQRT